MTERDIRNSQYATRTTGPLAAAAGAPASSASAGIEISKILRNTYMLLGLTLAWSALVAMVAMVLNVPYLGPIVTLVGFFGLLFAVH